MKHLFWAAAALLGSSVAHAGPYPLFYYEVTDVTSTDLGTLGGVRSEAYDVNNRGVVVGWSDDALGIAQSFYYVDGAMVPLEPSFGPHTNVATGINNRDEVSGTAERLRRPYALSGALSFGVTGLSTGEGVESSASAISDSGFVVGQRNRIDTPGHSGATIWTDLYTFDTLEGGDTVANDVNSTGEIVGRETTFGTVLLWRWTKDEITEELIPLPDYAGGCNYFEGDALGINNVGMVVGYTKCGGNKHAMYWDRVSAWSRDLGVLPTGTHSVAEDINDGGFITGYGDRVTGGFKWSLDTAFVFHPDFGFFALPRPKFAVWFGHCRAKALNERNATNGVIQVVGTCDTASGTSAVRWDVTVASRLIVPPLPFP